MKESHCVLLLTYIRTLRKNSSDPIPIKQQPLTPGDILFKPEKQPPIVTGFSPRAREQSIIGWKCDDAAVPGSFSRHASTADFLPLELPLGDSDDYLCPPASYTPMDKLVGVFMYVKYCPKLDQLFNSSWYQIVQPPKKTFTCAEVGVCEGRFWWHPLCYRYSLAKLLS